jgi:hypothetical protein
MSLEVTPDDAYRVADTMAEAGQWFTQEQRRIGNQLPELAGMTGGRDTDEVVSFAIIHVLRRAAGVGYVLDGVARNLHASGLDYEETDQFSAHQFYLAMRGRR